MSKSLLARCCAALVALSLTSPIQADEPASAGEKDATEDAPAVQSASENVQDQSPGAVRASTPEARIERILRQPLKAPLDYVDVPLSEVMAVISREYDLQIVLDTVALDALAISPDSEITVNLRNISLAAALELLLRSSPATEELTYLVHDEVLLITSEDVANERLEVRVYRVDDLIRDQYTGELDFDRLIDVIVSTVEMDSWMENGTGEGDIRSFPPGMLVVTQTRRVQQQLADLLAEIREVKADIENDATSNDDVAAKPTTRAIRIETVGGDDPERARDVIEEAIRRSVDWEGDNDLDEDEIMLAILPDRVIVRHLPRVVAQVGRVLHDLDLVTTPPGGAYGSIGGGGGF